MDLITFFESKIDFLDKYIDSKNKTNLFAINIQDFHLPDFQYLKAILGENRTEKILQKKLNLDRKRMILGDLLLFFILNKYYATNLDGISSIILDFNRVKINKKVLYFNKSHSSDMVVCAISDKKVGVDVQKHKDLNYKKIAKKYFNEKENKKCFFDVWCKKEAACKMQGMSILTYLNRFNCDYGYFQFVDIYDGYSLCICEEIDTTR